ncbi:CBS domain-containing protein [Kitasatospora sp. RB6PN24]|uniref:CBS domain-containing protein n=1 Tax=Kitasatospora humi TaxID=2893891 RepID=UPI001E5C4E1F|nr:CBS domain-containing protein [Kitasatospora humi]MCC9306103.1 CBS domain-containing protein [Kitasatospora humi]
MRVADLMTEPPVTVSPETSARLAARRMAEERVGCLLVVAAGELVGVVTDRDLVLRGTALAANPHTPVDRLMTVEPAVLALDDDLDTAYGAFRRTGVRRLPVLDGRRPVGLLAVDDLLLDVLDRLFDLLGPISWSALRDGGSSTPPTLVRRTP